MGQWGQDCDRECLCASGGESDPNTAAYTCSPGCLGAVCVAQALLAWTLQISAPVISMARVTTYRGRVSAVRAGRELCVTGPVLQAVTDTTAPSLVRREVI